MGEAHGQIVLTLHILGWYTCQRPGHLTSGDGLDLMQKFADILEGGKPHGSRAHHRPRTSVHEVPAT